MLRARLFGALEVELEGQAIDPPVSQRPWTVFAYLALSDRPRTRAELASRFWPDVLDQSAKASLRSALWALRRRLGDALVVDGTQVGLADDVWIDAREFERLAQAAPAEALALCRGDLLEGIEDEWALLARDRHREQVIELLERLAGEAEGDGRHRRAIELSREQVNRDPLDEEAHRRLMSRLAAAGDGAGAIRTYRSLAERLRRELGLAPSGQTRELAERLRAAADAPARAAASPVSGGEATIAGARSRGPGLLPLVGREAELAELERAFHAAVAPDGTGVVAVVRGEAGIGKTRLVTELRVRAARAGARTAACAALDLGGVAPLSLWAELIRELLPTLPAPPPDVAWPGELTVLVSEMPAQFVPAAPPPAGIAPELQRTRLFEAVVSLLAWAAREAPLLLVLEDVHSADAQSLELAAYAARRAADRPVMLVLTRRELPRSLHADRLEQALAARGLVACELALGPLGTGPIETLARSAARLRDPDIRRVVQRADGNALLAVEAARSLARGGDDVAPGLRSSARVTLGPLSGDVLRLIEVAAIAARPIDPAEMEALALTEPDEAATEALATGLMLWEQDRIGFRHALLRDAVYAEIAEPRRRGLHQRWATALLAGEESGAIPRPAEVARHLRLAGADRDAVPQLIRAAGQARSLAALEEAAGYLEEALAIAPDRADVWLELGEIEAWRLRRDAAGTAFAQAVSVLADGPELERARAWLRQARAYHGPICVPRAVLESSRTALELLEAAPGDVSSERSEAVAALAWAEAVAGDVEEAERLLTRLSGERHEPDELRIYDIGHARALALMRRGRFLESYGPSIAAGEAVGRVGRPDLAYGCWANAAGAATATGEHERALEFLDRGMAAIAGQGLRSLEVHLLGVRSFVLRGLGRLDAARQAAEAEQELAAQIGQPELMAMASHDRGHVARESGEYELAAELLAAALCDGAPISRPQTRIALAEALARGGHPDAAAEQLRAAVLEPVRPSDFPAALVPRLARVQGLVALARHEPIEAARRLEESIAGWERLLTPSIDAESITSVLADLGRPVVGLIEPARELARARADLALITQEGVNAVVP